MSEIYKNLSLENIENEEWRDIPNYEGLYQVSNMGRVKSIRYMYGNYREKILSQFLNNKNGYLQLNLWKEGKIKTCYVHRLVGNAFIENPNNLPCFNHKDEDKTNNCVDNLEPCDHKYNLNYKNAQARRVASTDYKAFQARRVASTDYKAIAEKKRNDPNKSKQVYQYDKNGTLVAIWDSTKECDRQGYNQGAVASCCRGERKSHRDFIWSYTEIN